MTFFPALDRKLLREVRRMKGQIITIALVLASGMTCFLAMRGTYESLALSRDDYYERHRFAHVFARVERAPESLARRIETLPGVAVAETRVAKDVTLPVEGLARPAFGRLLSLPPHGLAGTNAIRLQRGRMPQAGSQDEVVVLAAFARANGLLPGHRLPVVINGTLRRLQIVGVAESPEFIYAIRPGALADDPQRYAVLWMDRQAVASAFHFGGSFNDLSLRLEPGASLQAVLGAVDRLLSPFGGNGAVARKDQLSNRVLTGELEQLGVLAMMVPLIFLGVAAFLINMVLGRLIALQRAEIATLKAVGYTNGEVARHYLGLVGVVMVPGTALGVVGGWWLGRWELGFYQTVFRFPDLVFRLAPRLVVLAIAISGAAAILGALLAVRAAVTLPPAEAMRPPAPAHYRRGLVERLGLGRLVGASGVMVWREVERRPLRTALSSFGIAGAIALVILGHFGLDSLDHYLETMFLREQPHDLTVSFARPVAPRVVEDLRSLAGVLTAEGLRTVPIRVRYAQRTKDSVLIGLPSPVSLRRLVARSGQTVAVPPEGVLVTKQLGKTLGLVVGDRLDLELLEGERRLVRPTIAGFVDESVGLQVYAQTGLVAALEGDSGAVSAALLEVDPRKLEAVEAALRRSPQIIDVGDVRADVQRLRDMNGAAMEIWTAVSVVLGAAVIFGVVYNNARIALATRARELASLRVLGLSRGEISQILIAGLAIEVALAIPCGLWLGRAWGQLFFTTVDQEMFRFQAVVNGRTYLLAAAVAVLAAAASALWVRRSLDRLDLIAVLKTRE